MRIGYRLALLSLVAACNPPVTIYPEPEPEPPKRATTETSVPASFGKTWNALIDFATLREFPIKSTDRASGLLLTDRFRIPEPEPGKPHDFARCATSNGWRFTSPRFASLSFLVRGDSARSFVRAVATFTDDQGECDLSYGKLEESLEQLIRDMAAKP